MVPQWLTKRTGFKQWSRRYKLEAGAKDERLEVLLEWAEAREVNAPTIAPESSNVQGADRLAQHLYASLLPPHVGDGLERACARKSVARATPRQGPGERRAHR